MKMSTNSPSYRKLALLVGTMLSAPALAAAQDAAPASADDQPYTDEIIVRGVNIPDPQRNTSEVVSVLTSDDLVRQGDDTAALALTRLSGLSVVGGRYAYVRGLGDRYSSALLNGSPLPSTDPLRRQVPLDLFPSNILEGATVQKTFSPDYPGEFGGGVINLRTKRLPDEDFFRIKIGGGLNFVSTAKEGLVYRGSSADWTGLGGSIRNVPGPLQAAINTGQKINLNNFTQSELETIGESFTNTPVTLIQKEDLLPDFSAEMSAGGTISFDKFDLGLIGVIGYDSKQRTRNAIRQAAVGNVLSSDFQVETTNWDITTNAFGSASLNWDTSSVTLTGLIVRSSNKKAQMSIGTDSGAAPFGVLDIEKTAWYERQLISLQLDGDHEFGPLAVKWRTSVADTRRDAPYERSMIYSQVAPNPYTYEPALGNTTRFSYLNDQVFSGGLDLAYTIPLSSYRDAVFSAGFDYSKTDRDYALRSFQFIENYTAPNDVRLSRPDYVFQPDNIGTVFRIDEFTNRDDSYDGLLDTKAAYVSADVEIVPLVHVAAGVRYEDARERVITQNSFGDLPFSAPADLNNDYWLPGATVTWNFYEDMQLRLGYSHTIARPQFRELAYAEYTDPETDRSYRGNPFLVDSKFKNYDIRWEYYFGRNQYATLAGFYKDITNPIEEVVAAQAESGVNTRFINSPGAKLYGGEAEYRTRFEMPFDVPVLDNPEWLFSINYTYTHSEVNAGPNDLVINPNKAPNQLYTVPASVFALDGKPLQGTPKHIINAQFGWEAEHSQTTLLFGWVSKRILQRGQGALLDIIERPGANLDLVHKQDFIMFGQPVTFGLTARNLLGTKHTEFQLDDILGRVDTDTYKVGRTLSASLSMTF